MQHWSASLDVLSGPLDWAFGKGLGRYPASYFYRVPDMELPGSYAWKEDAGNGYLSLSGPRYSMSWGDLFRCRSGSRPCAAPIRSRFASARHRRRCARRDLRETPALQRELRGGEPAGEGAPSRDGTRSTSISTATRSRGGTGMRHGSRSSPSRWGAAAAMSDFDDVSLVGPDRRTHRQRRLRPRHGALVLHQRSSPPAVAHQEPLPQRPVRAGSQSGSRRSSACSSPSSGGSSGVRRDGTRCSGPRRGGCGLRRRRDVRQPRSTRRASRGSSTCSCASDFSSPGPGQVLNRHSDRLTRR